MGMQHMFQQSNHLWQQNKHFNTFGAGSLCKYDKNLFIQQINILLLNIPRKKYFVSCASANLCLNIVVPRQAGGGKKTGAGESETK